MIIGVLIINVKTNQHLYRATNETDNAKVNLFVQDFLESYEKDTDLIEKETYRYVFISLDSDYILAAQITYDELISHTEAILESIKKACCTCLGKKPIDLYEILIFVDNFLCGEHFINENEIENIYSMDSQDEKVYKLMLKHQEEEKRVRNKQAEKEYKAKKYQEGLIEEARALGKEIKSKLSVERSKEPLFTKIENSTEPVLILLKEKIKMEIDSENFVISNMHTGELSVIITDKEYKGVEIHMNKLDKIFKISPYLDKEVQSRGILRFSKERQLNKNIPLLKFNSALKKHPFSVEFWPSEDDRKFVNLVTIKANTDLENITVSFSSKDISDIEIPETEFVNSSNKVTVSLGTINNEEEASFELKYSSLDKDAIFPLSVNFNCKGFSTLDVKEVVLNDNSIDNYEFRKLCEIENYKIYNQKQ